MSSPKLKDPDYVARLKVTIRWLQSSTDLRLLVDDVEIQQEIIKSGVPVPPIPKGSKPDARNVFFFNDTHSYIIREMWGHKKATDNGRLMVAINHKKLTSELSEKANGRPDLIAINAAIVMEAILITLGEDPSKMKLDQMKSWFSDNKSN